MFDQTLFNKYLYIHKKIPQFRELTLCPFTYYPTTQTNCATESELKVFALIKEDYKNDHYVHKPYFKRLLKPCKIVKGQMAGMKYRSWWA